MKIFLDVGAYHGISARAAAAQRFKFDRIICFEPSSECIPYIDAINDTRITVIPCGMWNETTTKTLYGCGHYGASIFRDKPINDRGAAANSCQVNLIKVSDWVRRNIEQDDIVFMKLNCEGSECDIIDDLVVNNEISKLYSIMIDFDVGKIPSIQHREIEVRRLIHAKRINNICFSEDVMTGDSHEARIHNWLAMLGAEESLPLNMLRKKYGKSLKNLSEKQYHIRIIRAHLKKRYKNSSLYGIFKYVKGNGEVICRSLTR